MTGGTEEEGSRECEGTGGMNATKGAAETHGSLRGRCCREKNGTPAGEGRASRGIRRDAGRLGAGAGPEIPRRSGRL
jgi:hypothetical protein